MLASELGQVTISHEMLEIGLLTYPAKLKKNSSTVTAGLGTLKRDSMGWERVVQ